MNRAVTFPSGGFQLYGEIATRDGNATPAPGIVLASGFAGASYPKLVHSLVDAGYAVFAFDFRAYGKSGGVPGRVVPLEQVDDIRSAVTFLRAQPEVDPENVAVVGSSLGGATALAATATDERIKVCVAGCPPARSEGSILRQYDTPEKLAAFMERVERAGRDGTKIGRFEIVRIPEQLRERLPANTPMEFTAETVYGFLSFRSIDYVGKIAPRPLLLMHAENDDVVPVGQSRLIAERAGANSELKIVKEGNHFFFGSDEVIAYIRQWLLTKLPVSA